MRAVDLIRKKRDSGEHSREEMEFVISGYTNGDMQSAVPGDDEFYAVGQYQSEGLIGSEASRSQPPHRPMILRETLALALTVFGIAIGIPSGLAATRLIASMLFGLSPGDLSTIMTACLLLLAVASVAGYLPARRASSIDPSSPSAPNKLASVTTTVPPFRRDAGTVPGR